MKFYTQRQVEKLDYQDQVLFVRQIKFTVEAPVIRVIARAGPARGNTHQELSYLWSQQLNQLFICLHQPLQNIPGVCLVQKGMWRIGEKMVWGRNVGRSFFVPFCKESLSLNLEDLASVMNRTVDAIKLRLVDIEAIEKPGKHLSGFGGSSELVRVWAHNKGVEKDLLEERVLRFLKSIGAYPENNGQGKNYRDKERATDEKVPYCQDAAYWIPGNPATFATTGEKQWKNILNRHISDGKGIKVCGIGLQFYVKNLAPRGHPIDVDNLCEPVFSVLVNQLQWFGGSRSNIRWWYASKEQSDNSGLKLTINSKLIHELKVGQVKLAPVFDYTYTGVLPGSARDPVLAEWIESQLVGMPATQLENCAVRLRFSDRKVNLGEIATGKIKAFVDGLYPILGGVPGRPEDWRIHTLAVEKDSQGLPADSVQITVWEAV